MSQGDKKMNLETFKIKCPKCGFRETDVEKFADTEVGCEDCGTHTAIKCPKCERYFEHVWHGDVCEECGLIIDGRCSDHPNAKVIKWWTTKGLNRGG